MHFQKFKSDSFSVGGSHRSATTKNYGDITNKGSKVFIGFCSICTTMKSVNVSDNTIQAHGLSDFSKLGKKRIYVSKKDGKKCFKKSRQSFGYHNK